MIKNKSGFLLGEETIKLVLAVIAIIFLIVFVVYLYNNFSGGKELGQAKSSLAHLVSEINAGSTEVEVFSPKDWIISSWPHDYASTKDILPKLCSSSGWEKCLCICSFETLECNEQGVVGTCAESDFLVIGDNFHSIKIQNPPLILSINQQDKTISEAK